MRPFLTQTKEFAAVRLRRKNSAFGDITSLVQRLFNSSTSPCKRPGLKSTSDVPTQRVSCENQEKQYKLVSDAIHFICSQWCNHKKITAIAGPCLAHW